MQSFDTIDAYIASFPEAVQERLQLIRNTIRAAAPQAEETISYGMPAFRQQGALVYFAGYKNHIGFYPTASGIRNFEALLQAYKYSKGAIQFPHTEKLPVALVKQITRARVQENMEKAAAKKAGKATTAKSKAGNTLIIPGLSAPARRALENAGIRTLQQLSRYTAEQLLDLHGLGPSAIPRIEAALQEKGMQLRSKA